MADIVIINPRFEVSYWGMDHALPFMGKSANLPVACLPLLAALTPEEHTVTLMDENVEPIDWERCARADIVGVTGMSVQRFRMNEILTELKQRGVSRWSAGPGSRSRRTISRAWPTSIFVGEAEETWPQFLREWSQGLHQYRYEQAEKTDMTKVPTPRFDLLKMNRYAFGSLQFSRGCPFQCEFCDIIVTFGRRPRIKTGAQVLAELEAIRKTGMRIVFIVDDNLIGNKKAIKERSPRGDRLAEAEGLSADLLHGGLDRPGRRPRAARADGRGELHRHLHRDREPQRGIAPRDQEVPERPRRAGPCWRRSTGSRTPGWRSGAA